MCRKYEVLFIPTSTLEGVEVVVGRESGRFAQVAYQAQTYLT